MKEEEKKEKQTSLADSVADTVTKGDFQFPAEILEFSIDQALDDGLLKDIPVVGWIAKGLSVSSSISDRIFYHKILRFLVSLDDVEEHERALFVEKQKEDKVFKRRVGEHLIILLDKIDSIDKTALTAKCFSCFIRSEIDHEYFIDLAAVISRSTISDLKSLAVPSNERVTFRSITIAASSGILDYGIFKNDENESEMGHRLSDYGTDLRDIILGRKPSRFTRALEEKKERQEHHKKMKLRHISNLEEVRDMRNRNIHDDEIMSKLNISEQLLKTYLSKI